MVVSEHLVRFTVLIIDSNATGQAFSTLSGIYGESVLDMGDHPRFRMRTGPDYLVLPGKLGGAFVEFGLIAGEGEVSSAPESAMLGASGVLVLGAVSADTVRAGVAHLQRLLNRIASARDSESRLLGHDVCLMLRAARDAVALEDLGYPVLPHDMDDEQAFKQLIRAVLLAVREQSVRLQNDRSGS